MTVVDGVRPAPAPVPTVTVPPGVRAVTVPMPAGGWMTAVCPAWCTSDHGFEARHGSHPVDFVHEGDPISLSLSTEGEAERILAARLQQRPFAERQAERVPYMVVCPAGGDDLPELAPFGVDEVIAAVRGHLAALESMKADLQIARAEHGADR